MRFYNRENEIAGLKRICNLSFTHNLTYDSSDRQGAAIVDDFVREIHGKLHGYVPEGLRSVTGVLRHQPELAKTVMFTLFIDEFREFMTVNQSVFSDLQNLWDSYRSDT